MRSVSQLSLRELVRVIASCLRESLQSDVTGVSLYDSEANQFRAYMFDLPENFPPIEEGTLMSIEGSIGGAAGPVRRFAPGSVMVIRNLV